MSSVIVYSAPWCAGCKVVKQSLGNVGIIFEEVDITSYEGGQKAKDLCIKSIPVTYTPNGKSFIGSRPETIKAILEAIVD